MARRSSFLALRGTVLFVPFVPGATLVDGIDPGAAAFNIDALWKQISAVTIPPQSELLPKLAAVATPPGRSLGERLFTDLPLAKFTCAIAAVALLVFAPKLWLISIGLGLYVVFAGRGSKEHKIGPLRQQLSDVENRWNAEIVSWQKRIGVSLLVRPDFSKDEFGDKTMCSNVGVIVGWVQNIVT